MTDQGRAILLAVGGGVAAYKSATLCSRLAQRGCDVQVVMTKAALEFVGAATFSALSGKPVASSSFDPHYPLGAHIELAERPDLLIVAPTTANLLAKFASGIADDLLTTLFLQVECPVVLAPAMSSAMWNKPSVQRNVKQLQEDGCNMIGPESGWLSCRRRGDGRMSEPESILSAAMEIASADR